MTTHTKTLEFSIFYKVILGICFPCFDLRRMGMRGSKSKNFSVFVGSHESWKTWKPLNFFVAFSRTGKFLERSFSDFSISVFLFCLGIVPMSSELCHTNCSKFGLILTLENLHSSLRSPGKLFLRKRSNPRRPMIV